MTASRKVLSVGQCSFDHGSISRYLKQSFGASVVAADTLQDAVGQLHQESFDLVLVNRLLDADGSEGLQILDLIRNDAAISPPPVMLVSNYADAQAQAVAAGAEPGFGKSSLNAPATVELLRRYLG